MAHFFNRYLLPGLVFQGVVIGGGYATGRELAEFFFPNGPVGGLLGMGAAAILWGVVMAVSFELCRIYGCRDYRHFFQHLLGRAWFLFEILLVVLMIIVMSVLAAASGEIMRNILGVSPIVGTVALLVAIGSLVFFGGTIVERFMGFWSLLLYGCYTTLVVWCISSFGTDIAQTFREIPNHSGWLLDGIRYAGYNLAVVPMVFFCLNHIRHRREAVIAGLISGIIGILPAVFLFVAMMSAYEQAGVAPIPSALLLEKLDARWFEILFQVVLLGTLVQTGVGMVHSVNERVAQTMKDRGRTMPAAARPVVAAALMCIAALCANVFGLVNLIANGYGVLTFGFIAVFVVPVLTVGLWKVLGRSDPPSLAAKTSPHAMTGVLGNTDSSSTDDHEVLK